MVYRKKSMTGASLKIKAPAKIGVTRAKTFKRDAWALIDGVFCILLMCLSEGQVKNAAKNGGIMNQTTPTDRIKTRIGMVVSRVEKLIPYKLVTFIILCALWTVILYN